MDDFLVSAIRSSGSKFAVRDEQNLKTNLRQLEEECREKFSDIEPNQVNRRLWFHLVIHSIELENIELALLLVAKLKIAHLALLLRSILDQPTSNNHYVGIVHLAKYFHVQGANLSPTKFNLKIISGFEFRRILAHCMNEGDWRTAIHLIDTGSFPSTFKNSHRCLVYQQLGETLELDENLPDALLNYERSGTRVEHSVRIIIKQHQRKADEELRNYCVTNTDLQDFFVRYSILRYNIQQAQDVCQLHNNLEGSVKCSLVCGDWVEAERTVVALLPDVCKQFISDTSTDKWMNQRRLDYIGSTATTLGAELKGSLVELASNFCRVRQFNRACELYLFLDRPEIWLEMAAKFLSRQANVKLNCQLGSTSRVAWNLIEFVDQQRTHREANGDLKSSSNGNSVVFLALLRLGLLDEALRVFSTDYSIDEDVLMVAIVSLEKLVDERQVESLAEMDPKIASSTLTLMFKHLNTSNENSSTLVITFIILCMTIFLLKIDTSDISMVDDSIAKLEIMFGQTAESMDRLDIHATESLLRSTNALISAVKDKLDALSDSEIIPEAFRKLVVTIAARCMIESQYRSAAMLYSQIEDNVSAIKSLMRLGDVDIVINFSLLVRDITVSRITMNYLRHMEVDQAIIDDFITRSKT